MLIGLLWKYEYIVNLRKMAHVAAKGSDSNSKIFSKNDLIYSNIILYFAVMLCTCQSELCGAPGI